MSQHLRGWVRRMALVALGALVLSACSNVVDGAPSVGNAPDAQLSVKGDSNGSFDRTVKNSLSDIESFWKTSFPKVSGGKQLTPLKGGLYSVDGLKVAQTKRVDGPASQNQCAQRRPSFVVDNGAFCLLDDSIAWDRAPSHLFAQLADKYGGLVAGLIFAHEYGHAISYRLGVFDRHDLRTIDTESQADCAAGAWAASALKGQEPHFRDVTPKKIDDALEGFLNGRDKTPTTEQDISHGNGFDRLSAVADGIARGVTYCFSKDYFASRTYTERPFTSQQDLQSGGNTPLAEVVKTAGTNFFVSDLNRFWTGAAKSIGKTFQPVKIAEAAHPKCDSAGTSSFGYCADDNTVYFDKSFALRAYNSLPAVKGDQDTGNITLLNDQPGDFALGVLFSIGWGMAVRNQLFNRSQDDGPALTAAICYSGSYAKDINIAQGSPQAQGKTFVLSPADLDEATSSMLGVVGQKTSFGARGTSGLDRIQAFVKGYKGGLSVC